MIRKLTALMAVLLTVGLVGCELENGGDTDGTNPPPDGDSSNPPPDTDTVDPGLAYRFVRIDDQSTPGEGALDSGADIDSVILTKAGGAQSFADEVLAYEHGGGAGFTDEADPTEALNAPDAFYDWDAGDTSVCDVEGGFVSLGGMGGVLVVRMPAEIAAGDNLTVLEVGGCDFGGANPAIPEEVEISVSVGSEVAGTWQLVGSGDGPEISLTVPTLPVVLP